MRWLRVIVFGVSGFICFGTVINNHNHVLHAHPLMSVAHTWLSITGVGFITFAAYQFLKLIADAVELPTKTTL